MENVVNIHIIMERRIQLVFIEIKTLRQWLKQQVN